MFLLGVSFCEHSQITNKVSMRKKMYLLKMNPSHPFLKAIQMPALWFFLCDLRPVTFPSLICKEEIRPLARSY